MECVVKKEYREPDVLIGKTIVDAKITGHGPYETFSGKILSADDCINWLHLNMSDGTKYIVEGTYGGWSGGSCDEYPQYVNLYEVIEQSDNNNPNK